MYIKKINQFLVLLMVSLILSGCVVNKDGKYGLKKKEPWKVKGNFPTDIQAKGKAEISKTIELGPKPVATNNKRIQKRKIISSEIQKNYLSIPDKYPLLKQNVTFKFRNIEFKEAMLLMGKVGKINILVGEEIAGTISAELINVPWDKAFQALLDMKNFAADIDASGNLIRIHTPSTLTTQDTYKSARADMIKKKVEAEDSTDPVISEIFRLFYISPAEANKTISALFAAEGSSSSPITLTEEATTRSIIVRGKEKDLNTVSKVLKEIDIKTKQVLIEAFIVEANSDFEKAMGVAVGGYYYRQGETIGGTVGTSTGKTNNTIAAATGGLGTTNDALTKFDTFKGNSGVGIIKRTGSAVISANIQALEKQGIVKQISNPKIFTLNNMLATVTQGTLIPFASTGESGGTEFAAATMELKITPSIVGDGNVLLDIDLKNDSAGKKVDGGIPINTMQIVTKLLVADGDVVVIGGIKKETEDNGKQQVPGLGDVPVIGNLFKGKYKQNKLDELLIFIAPKVL